MKIKTLPPVIERENFSDILTGIASRLKKATEGRVPEIAAKIGVSRSTLYAWLAGQFQPDLAKVGELAAATGFTVGWLLSGEGEQDARIASARALLTDYVFVEMEPPGRKPAVAFYEPWLDETLLGTRDDPKAFAGDTPSVKLMLVGDDAMEPTIRAGDLLLIDTGAGLSTAEIARARKEGRSMWEGIYAFRAAALSRTGAATAHLVARRLHYRLDGAMIISCDNPKYPEETYPPKARNRPGAFGRIIWRGTRI
jgi:transcriptional regulator with XRE-family HTH domain